MVHSSAFLGSLLVIFFCCSLAYSSSSEPSIAEVCKNYREPGYCWTFLDGKGGTKISYLAEFAISSGIVEAATNKGKIDALGRKTSDQKLLKSYESCSKHYHTAITDFFNTRKFLQAGDLDQMRTVTIDATQSLKNCTSAIEPGFDADVGAKHSELIRISEVVHSIAYTLYESGGYPHGKS